MWCGVVWWGVWCGGVCGGECDGVRHCQRCSDILERRKMYNFSAILTGFGY